MHKHNVITVREFTTSALNHVNFDSFAGIPYTIDKKDYRGTSADIERLDPKVKATLVRVHAKFYCGMTHAGVHKFTSEPYKHETYNHVYKLIEIDASQLLEQDAQKLADDVARDLECQAFNGQIANGWRRDEFYDYIRNKVHEMSADNQQAMSDDFDTCLKFMIRT